MMIMLNVHCADITAYHRVNSTNGKRLCVTCYSRDTVHSQLPEGLRRNDGRGQEHLAL